MPNTGVLVEIRRMTISLMPEPSLTTGRTLTVGTLHPLLTPQRSRSVVKHALSLYWPVLLPLLLVVIEVLRR
jgi:hypothetical protein